MPDESAVATVAGADMGAEKTGFAPDEGGVWNIFMRALTLDPAGVGEDSGPLDALAGGGVYCEDEDAGGLDTGGLGAL